MSQTAAAPVAFKGASGAVVLTPRNEALDYVAKHVKPHNGWLLVKARKLSSVIELAQTAKNASNYDWRFDVISAPEKYYDEKQGKWMNTPISAGQTVCLVAGSWQSYPHREWAEEGYALAHWQMVIGVVKEADEKEKDATKIES